jgi:SAM-dependent methyltransferase
VTSIRGRFDRALAHQLGNPRGPLGRLVASALDKRNAAVIGAAADAAAQAPNAVLADVGFGGGVGLRMLLDRSDGAIVHGVEISETMLARARTRFAREVTAGRLALHRASMAKLPLPDCSVDGLITVNTLYFVDELVPALQEFARILTPAGRAAIGVGDPEAMARLRFAAHGFRLRPLAELTAAIEASGLAVSEHHRIGESRVPSHLLIVTPRGQAPSR